MARVAPYHSLATEDRQRQRVVYHNHEGCPMGQRIQAADRREGGGRFEQCDICANLDRLSSNPPEAG